MKIFSYLARFLPLNIEEFLKLMRLHQPVGIILLFLPCLFGTFLSLKETSAFDLTKILYLIFLFFVGSVLMRSAGCIINDLMDQKFDQKVTRTKNRPLASGNISRQQALILLAILLIGSLIILLQFNLKTIVSGFVALILVTSYPLMKRFTYYPQIFLGLTFNFGVLMSSLAILNSINTNTIILYFAAIIWTLIYDTIYAYQDLEDDLKIGLKSTAIKFQKNPQIILIFLNGLMFLSLFFLGVKAKFDYGFFLILIFCTLLSSRWIRKCNFKNSANCLAIFKNNMLLGFLISIAILAG